MADLSKIVLPNGSEYNIKDETARTNKADKADTVLTTTVSRGRLANSIVGTGSFAFGNDVTASGDYSQAEGENTQAVGVYSHAEGASSSNVSTSYGARGKADHAEGYNTLAHSGTASTSYGAHAEGNATQAISPSAHAEGTRTKATGNFSHAEGYYSIASGYASHAEGDIAYAIGANSHAEGLYTRASGNSMHASGKYNVDNENSDFAFVVGNGTATDARSNAVTLYWDGTARFAGDIYVNASADGTGGTKLMTSDNTKLPLAGGTMTGSIFFKDNGMERGAIPSANCYKGVVITDKNDKRIGQLQVGSVTNGQNQLGLLVLTNTNTSTADEYGGIYIYKTVGVSGNKNLVFNANTGECTADTFTGHVTWDNIIQKPTSYTDTTKLSLTGGTLTQVANADPGTVVLHIDKRNLTTAIPAGSVKNIIRISYKNQQMNADYYDYPIAIIGTDGTDGYNAGISLGSKNGVTFLSSGESASVMPSVLDAHANENTYITADGTVKVYAGCANDGSSYTGPWTFNTSGVLSSPGGFSGLTNAQAIAALGATPVYTTTNQSIAGNKEFNGMLFIKTGSITSNMVFGGSDQEKTSAAFGATGLSTYGAYTKYKPSKFYFRNMSPKADETDTTTYYEQFELPQVNIGRTSSATYDIFTSKNAGYAQGSYSNTQFLGVYGFLSTGSTVAFIFIPMNYSSGITSCTISSLKLSLRVSSGGYLGGAQNFDVTSYTKEIILRPKNGFLEIRVTKSDGWGLTNNIPFAGDVTMSFVLS